MSFVAPRKPDTAKKVQWCINLVGAEQQQVQLNQYAQNAQQAKVARQNKTNERLKTLDHVKETTFLPGTAAKLEKLDLKSGKHFDRVLAGMKVVEKRPTKSNLTSLEAMAQDYLDHVERDLSQKEKDLVTTKKKVAICEKLIHDCRLRTLCAEREALGPPPWTGVKEALANSLDAKVAFEESARGHARAKPSGQEGNSGSWRVENKAGQPGDLFIFKPSDSESPMGYGWKRGGGAAREVMAKNLSDMLSATIGLDVGVCSTNLCKISNDMLPEVKTDHFGQPIRHPSIQGEYEVKIDRTKASQRTGSMQEMAQTQGGLARRIHADDTLINRIPQSEVENLFVFDLITLNLDRHGENILVEDNGGIPKLRPIDHGNALPSKDALRGQNSRMNDWALMALPQSNQPLSKAILDKLALIDEKSLVEGLQKSKKTMAKLDPEIAETIGDEEFSLVAFNIKLLRVAGAMRATMAELQDVMRRDMLNLMDVNEDDFEYEVQQAVDRARQRTRERAVLSSWDLNITSILNQNGWSAGMKSTGRFLRDMPDVAIKIIRGNIENPAKLALIDDMIAQLGGRQAINEDLESMTCSDRYTLLERLLNEQKNRINRQGIDALGWGEAVDAMHASLRGMIGECCKAYHDQNGDELLRARGKDPNQMTPRDKWCAMATIEFERLSGPGGRDVNEYLEYFMFPSDPSDMDKVKFLRAFHEFRALGGLAEVVRLGGDTDPDMTVIKQLEQLKMLLAAEAMGNAAFLFSVDEVPLQRTRVEELAGKVVTRLQNLPQGERRNQLLKRYRAVLELKDSDRLDEAMVEIDKILNDF